ncbi:pheromone-dependent cell cycle arrest protein [Grosmannia clavigera kw1407]|uniref:Pheromone-dependent cell cycle arrest protein n=1 Tax=Grosmannia clavigera (strain kw1407 / UAMH 11150) TaxID=655863 RepID=F0X8V4_GROCL|nr:pheromone-dependent cell cycle arrest protein [Grosmannia clavigera kw1407]EFX05791.1 pheromone-dependent cell cycle arrest protein [Grosmannia clavigera kw1407]
MNTGAVVGSSNAGNELGNGSGSGSGNGNGGGNGNNSESGGGPQQGLDSLSLLQLRRLAAELPRNEPVAYDYVYEDTGSFDEEVDEWFSYQIWQWVRLNNAQQHFEARWERERVDAGRDLAWEAVEPDVRERFVAGALAVLAENETRQRHRHRPEAIGVLLYVVLGRWAATCGGPAAGARRTPAVRTVARQRQLDAIRAGVALVAKVGGAPVLWEALRKAFEPFWGPEDPQQLPSAVFQDAQDELANLMTIVYVMMQAVLSSPLDLAASYVKLVSLEPPIPDFMMAVASRLRWDDSTVIPQCQVFLLLWKSLLLVFGGSRELAETKKATAESTADADKEKNLIMASPLDYHAFRQEITSKYPAYIPPQPLIPLEDDSTTLLPPLPNQASARSSAAGGVLSGPPSAHGGASILNQPVHIATPAPSPPPSPAAAGKGVKKQNYQTNQNFPFMYPPLDATSNGVGGKGAAALQDVLVGRKWEGSDVPSSILEAGELFSNRVRMTRATRQLWEERERFLKFERGWDSADDDLIEELDLSSLTLAEKEELGLVKPSEVPAAKKDESNADLGPRPEELNERIKQRLDALEDFYREALPHLQSLVIVLLKTVLMNVAVLMAQVPQSQQQHPAATGANGRGNGGTEGMEQSAEEIDAARTREISSKAVSGILLLLLKWLKVSHVLKFEYLTQLLLDCNYVPLLLKLWAHQDVQQLVDSRTDRVESGFFYFCNIRAGAPEQDGPDEEEDEGDAEEERDGEEDGEDEEESEDECAPPAIKRQRSPQQAAAAGPTSTATAGASTSAEAFSSQLGRRLEVDEFGYPIGDVAAEPITEFNRRNFFSLINLLRVMQKICKNKAHRNLLLVHYKSSNILRKMLKVPQPELRLYTLKLFKNQVPYCGRKWRQGNMRVITAVYLHCRPELRDEWLAGSDVEGDVESSLPLEQALRSLTHWFNVRRYPDKMAAEVRMALREEHDFFVRELKLDLNWTELAEGESVMGEWEG